MACKDPLLSLLISLCLLRTVAPTISKVLIGCCSQVWWPISTLKDNFTLSALITVKEPLEAEVVETFVQQSHFRSDWSNQKKQCRPKVERLGVYVTPSLRVGLLRFSTGDLMHLLTSVNKDIQTCNPSLSPVAFNHSPPGSRWKSQQMVFQHCSCERPINQK